ncbi:MAG: type IV toxin-antitoxin system AbiEi family antitoxin domain-containing protein, partial [Nocardioides sp.]
MDPLRLLCESQGFFSRTNVRAAGLDDRDIAAAVRAGVWQRVRRGYYTYVDLWSPLDEVGRHLVRCRCVLDRLGPVVALSHVSGALAHGLTVWDMDLSQVHV